MRLIVISLLVMFLAISPALATPQEDFYKGLAAHAAGNYKQAVKLFRQAAEQGDARAQYNLGQMYRKGEGVAQDGKQMVKWWRKAAEQGDADAQLGLGVMYNNGHSVVKDYKQAAKWFHQAAEQGDAWAQLHLGLMYGLGKGVVKNEQTAYMFFLLVLANEQDESKRETIKKIVTPAESKLTPAQIQSAQNDAADYQAKIDAR